jgi:hypothetical protein
MSQHLSLARRSGSGSSSPFPRRRGSNSGSDPAAVAGGGGVSVVPQYQPGKALEKLQQDRYARRVLFYKNILWTADGVIGAPGNVRPVLFCRCWNCSAQWSSALHKSVIEPKRALFVCLLFFLETQVPNICGCWPDLSIMR